MSIALSAAADGLSGTLQLGGVDIIKVRSDKSVVLILANYTDDAAATTGGIPIGGLYRTGATVKARTV